MDRLAPADLDRFLRLFARRLPCPVRLVLTGGGQAMVLGGTRPTGDLDFALVVGPRFERHWPAVEAAVAATRDETGIASMPQTSIAGRRCRFPPSVGERARSGGSGGSRSICSIRHAGRFTNSRATSIRMSRICAPSSVVNVCPGGGSRGSAANRCASVRGPRSSGSFGSKWSISSAPMGRPSGARRSRANGPPITFAGRLASHLPNLPSSSDFRRS
jgi:hypothetical protein